MTIIVMVVVKMMMMMIIAVCSQYMPLVIFVVNVFDSRN